MSIFLRLCWFKILVVLCVSYSTLVAKTSSPQIYNTAKYFNSAEQTVLTSSDFQNRFDPFELIEKNEQNEVIEEDFDSHHISSFCFFSFKQSIYQLKFLKENVSTIVFSDFNSTLKLFVIFHCWKLHS